MDIVGLILDHIHTTTTFHGHVMTIIVEHFMWIYLEMVGLLLETTLHMQVETNI
jgi:hypothetical protein